MSHIIITKTGIEINISNLLLRNDVDLNDFLLANEVGLIDFLFINQFKIEDFLSEEGKISPNFISKYNSFISKNFKQKTPITPLEKTPITPLEKTPITPLEKTPITPLEKTPITPLEKTPITFDTFIENEIYVINKLKEKIPVVEFRKLDYEFLRPIFNNVKMISDIIDIIIDILESMNINRDYKYIILGDFLFTILVNDFTDSNNLIIKMNRGDYILKIETRSIINNYIYDENINYKKIHQKLIIGLCIANILKKNVIRTKNEEGWSSITYIQFEIKNHFFCIENIGYSKNPFNLVKISDTTYIIGSFRNIWIAKRKKKEMGNIRDIKYVGVIIATKIGLIISSNLYKINENILDMEKKKLLLENNCNSLGEYFSKIINSLNDLEKIRSLKKDIKLLKIRSLEHKKLLINYQKLIAFKILEKIKLDQNFYLPCFIDNRGRQYYGSLVSPTFYKIFRYLYRFDIKKKFIDLENSKFYNKILKYKWVIDCNNFDDFKSYILLILLIEVGKFFIKKNNKSIYTTEEIIICGWNNYIIKNILLDFEEILYINKIYKLIDSLYNNNLSIDEINEIIYKDATASGLQNFGVLLGYKPDKLKYLNLNGDDWCDTYQYIIEKYLVVDKNPINLYKRKYWKGTIMTIPYNSVWFSCYQKFNKILEDNDNSYLQLSKIEKKKIMEIHRIFYEEIKKNLKKEFYRGEENKKKKFPYYKLIPIKKKEYKINYKNHRDKYIDTEYMLIADEKSTVRADDANNMHYLDSLLVQEILINMDAITIHDCFGVRLCELHHLMDITNKYYSRHIGWKTYSIHVLI